MEIKNALSIFDYSNNMRDAFRSHGIKCTSLDIAKGKKGCRVDIVSDILQWDHKKYKPDHFDFLFIALPCQVYSIASGAYHFRHSVPVTSAAINAINIIRKEGSDFLD